MPTINFELRNRPDKKGYCQIRVVVQDRGKRVFIPLAVRLLKSDWDQKTQQVKPSHSQASTINHVLTLKRSELEASMATESLSGKISLEKIAGRKLSKTLFQTFAGNCLERWEKTKSINSIRAYRSMLLKALEFDRKITVEDITPDWLARYEAHCWTECGPGGTLKLF